MIIAAGENDGWGKFQARSTKVPLVVRLFPPFVAFGSCCTNHVIYYTLPRHLLSRRYILGSYHCATIFLFV